MTEKDSRELRNNLRGDAELTSDPIRGKIKLRGGPEGNAAD